MLLLVALAPTGCSARKTARIAWTNEIHVKPMLPAQAAESEDNNTETPVFNLDMPPLAAVLIPAHSAPPKPRSSSGSPPPAVAAADPEKPEAPRIAPQLTPGERVAAQQEASQSLGIAEKNLAVTRGRTLNPLQVDLVSKIKGFLKDAREAAQASDWARARSLAKKAQVLSEQLAESL